MLEEHWCKKTLSSELARGSHPKVTDPWEQKTEVIFRFLVGKLRCNTDVLNLSHTSGHKSLS